MLRAASSSSCKRRVLKSLRCPAGLADQFTCQRVSPKTLCSRSRSAGLGQLNGWRFRCRLHGIDFEPANSHSRPGAGHPQWQLPGSRKIFAVEGPQCCDPIGFIPSTMLTLATGNFESGLRNWSVAAKAWFELVSRNHSLASRVQSHHLSGVKKR